MGKLEDDLAAVRMSPPSAKDKLGTDLAKARTPPIRKPTMGIRDYLAEIGKGFSEGIPEATMGQHSLKAELARADAFDQGQQSHSPAIKLLRTMQATGIPVVDGASGMLANWLDPVADVATEHHPVTPEHWAALARTAGNVAGIASLIGIGGKAGEEPVASPTGPSTAKIPVIREAPASGLGRRAVGTLVDEGVSKFPGGTIPGHAAKEAIAPSGTTLKVTNVKPYLKDGSYNPEAGAMTAVLDPRNNVPSGPQPAPMLPPNAYKPSPSVDAPLMDQVLNPPTAESAPAAQPPAIHPPPYQFQPAAVGMADPNVFMSKVGPEFDQVNPQIFNGPTQENVSPPYVGNDAVFGQAKGGTATPARKAGKDFFDPGNPPAAPDVLSRAKSVNTPPELESSQSFFGPTPKKAPRTPAAKPEPTPLPHVDEVPMDYKGEYLSSDMAKQVNGEYPILKSNPKTGEVTSRVKSVSSDGKFAMIETKSNGIWKPKKVPIFKSSGPSHITAIEGD